MYKIQAYKEGLVEPTLYGERAVIEQICKEEGLDIAAFNIVDEKSDTACVSKAVAAVVAGEADVLMKGLVSTDKYMRGILNKEAGLFPPKGVLSHVSIVEMPCYPKLLVISDVAVIPQPDFKQKQKQIGYLAQTAKLLGIATPKIACIAPSEQLLPSVVSSTEGALLAKMADRGQLGNVIVDGPLSLDVALFKEVAEHKKVKGSSVAGDPDCLLFPNIESANVFFKSATHLCKGELAAMVMGTKVPCVLTSRGDTSLTKLYSIALACLAAK
ncbi:MAG: phosphate butyryltransferase [Alistipes sp.]|nr:phosphate butyryltransferase [Alistipes sp.]